MSTDVAYDPGGVLVFFLVMSDLGSTLQSLQLYGVFVNLLLKKAGEFSHKDTVNLLSIEMSNEC